MSCLFSPVVAGALQRPRAATWRPRPTTAVEAVNLTIHRSHSTAAAINKIHKVRKTTRRHRLGQTSCPYRSPPEMRPFTPPSTIIYNKYGEPVVSFVQYPQTNRLRPVPVVLYPFTITQ